MAEEEQFTSGGVRSSVGGPTTPWAGPSTSAGRVIGPQLPPSMGKSADVGAGDDDLERALKESEDPRN